MNTTHCVFVKRRLRVVLSKVLLQGSDLGGRSEAFVSHWNERSRFLRELLSQRRDRIVGVLKVPLKPVVFLLQLIFATGDDVQLGSELGRVVLLELQRIVERRSLSRELMTTNVNDELVNHPSNNALPP